MARQEGLIKLKGQMGGVSFYKSAQDGYLARTKGGVDGERIKNDAAFVRTRENGAEFARAGVAGKQLRTALRALTINTKDSRMSSRLTSEMMKVVKSDGVSARGERTVVGGQVGLWKGFEFNENAKLGSTFFGSYEPAIDRVAGALAIQVPAFIPGNMVAWPQGATHIRLVAGVARVDFESGDSTSNVGRSEEIALTNVEVDTQVLEVPFTPGVTHSIFVVFGVEFLQLVNGQMYALKNGAYNALTVVEVDVAD